MQYQYFLSLISLFIQDLAKLVIFAFVFKAQNPEVVAKLSGVSVENTRLTYVFRNTFERVSFISRANLRKPLWCKYNEKKNHEQRFYSKFTG